MTVPEWKGLRMTVIAQQVTPVVVESGFPWDTIMNIVFFGLGTALGFFQIWQANNHRAKDQESKFVNIDKNISDIQKKLAIIEGVTSRLVDMDKNITVLGATSSIFQDRMFGLVEKQVKPAEQVLQATNLASEKMNDEIKAIIDQTLASSSDIAKESIDLLEKKINSSIDEFNNKISDIQSKFISSSSRSAFDVIQPFILNSLGSIYRNMTLPQNIHAYTSSNILEYGERKISIDKDIMEILQHIIMDFNGKVILNNDYYKEISMLVGDISFQKIHNSITTIILNIGLLTEGAYEKFITKNSQEVIFKNIVLIPK